MEDKNTVIDAKIGNLNELTKVLSVKEPILDDTTFQKSEQTIRIFIIKYGRSTHWKVLLTTDTSMNFVRAFEL